MQNTTPNHKSMEDAGAFLAALDPACSLFNFRTFDDSDTNALLQRKKFAPFAQVAHPLAEINRKGAGVFVVINDGGQTKNEITRVRAVFADTDGAPLEPILAAGIKPHIISESSPGKWHVYWLVADFPLDKFGLVQMAIAEKFGTDPAVKDLPRVMRLPGFYHRKGEPFLTHIVELAHHSRYSFDEIVSGLELNLTSERPKQGDPKTDCLSALPAYLNISTGGNLTAIARSATLAEAEKYLRWIDPDCDRARWWDVLAALAHEFGAEAEDLARRWSMGLLRNGGEL